MERKCTNCGMTSKFDAMPRGVCRRCEEQGFAEKQREVAAEIPAGPCEFQVIRGGSGRWIARRIVRPGVRPTTGRPIFVGHVPKRAPDADSIIARQIARKWQAREFATVAEATSAPSGGSVFTVTVNVNWKVE